MSKIGKKYILSSDDSAKTRELYSFLKNAENNQVYITDFSEQYDNETNSYYGSIVLSGDLNATRELYNSEDLRLLIKGTKTDALFSADMHYEELLELQNSDIHYNITKSAAALNTYVTVPIADSVNIYKFKTLLEYNFLVKNYENFLSSSGASLKETALPYFYEVLNDLILSGNYKGLEGTSFFESPSAIITSSVRNELKTNVVPSEISASTTKNDVLKIDKYLQRINPYKEQFPFYADISFDTHELGVKSLSRAFQEKDLFKDLFNDLAYTNNSSSLLSAPFINYDSSSTNTRIDVKETDLGEFLHGRLDSIASTDFTFIFDINQRIDSKARTFMEVLEGKEEYSEVIGYNLKKYQNNTSTLIQEWYLPNTSEGKFNWIDTQVKYGETYTYKLDLIVLTFATQYNITDIKFVDGKLVLNFINNPLVKTYVLKNLTDNANISLGATYTNALLDYPPMEPEVELVPYVGVDNKIKLNFNTSIGLKTVTSVEFDESEKTINNTLRLAQNKDPNSHLLTYQSDEPDDFIEIYRLDYKPSSYNDFFNNKIQTLSTFNTAGASFVDTIDANKKYYYIARAKNFHKFYSNPTPIYELEILNDNGLILPYINVVEFETTENKKQSSKPFKRYLKIQPATRHRVTNFEKTDENDVQLGVDDAAPWNKKFKIRITSKSTGKKIDVNVAFKYNKPT